MEGIAILLFLILLGPLAMLFGVDSRTSDERGWWPGTPPRDRRDSDVGGLAQAKRAPGQGMFVRQGSRNRLETAHSRRWHLTRST